MPKPDCYDCEYRRDLAGDAHSCCLNLTAHVLGSEHGTKNGWFYWPLNFDPIWLESCDGFKKKMESKK
jgi:hypothetical protein